MKTGSVGVALLGLCLLSGSASAAVGKVDLVFSPARVYSLAARRGGNAIKLEVGQPVLAGDVVTTIAGQTAIVELEGSSSLVLGEKAEAELVSESVVELRSGAAFVHVGSGYLSSNLFQLRYPNGLLGALAGDFEARIGTDKTKTTIYSISSILTAAHNPAELTDTRKTLPVDSNYKVVLGGGGQPAVYQFSELFEFEGQDQLFGKLMDHLRKTRFPLPTYDASTGGSVAGSTGSPKKSVRRRGR